MHTVVLSPNDNSTVDLDSTTTALNTAVKRPAVRGSKLAQFTVNYSKELQQIIIQHIGIQHIMIPYIRIILPFSPRKIKETRFSNYRGADTPH
jgi:hypothetical protein